MPKSFAQKLFGQTMLKATRLTGKGQLMDATRMIQRALASLNPLPANQTANQPFAEPDARPVAPFTSREAVNDPDIIDVEAYDITPRRQAPTVPVDQPETARPAPPSAGAEPSKPVAASPVDQARRPSAFTEGSIQFKGDHYPYRLYLPAGPSTGAATAGAAMPLVVLLHGCKQDALDFSKGTGMNVLADQQQFAVLYPQQIAKANAGSCWNWFETEHQSRSGEPGMIAALVKKMLEADHDGLRIDANRVYIAGLSAGGAMATITAGLYPELFAAVGVHSGLPAGSANSMIGAFSAMRRGSSAGEPAANAIPTIVFHGAQDQTVHPDNGEHISASALAALKKSGVAFEKTETKVSSKGDKPAHRVVYQDASGKPLVEHWQVSNGGHAWFGGASAGSYTDPQAPSASQAMVAFFMQHSQTGQAESGTK